jgi:hypothetical protein
MDIAEPAVDHLKKGIADKSESNAVADVLNKRDADNGEKRRKRLAKTFPLHFDIGRN